MKYFTILGGRGGDFSPSCSPNLLLHEWHFVIPTQWNMKCNLKVKGQSDFTVQNQ